MKHNFYVVLFTIISLLGAVNADSEEFKKDKKTKKILKNEIKDIVYKNGRVLKLKLRQNANVWDSKLENSFRYRIYVEPDVKLQFSKYFFSDIRLGLGATRGSVQSRFGDLRASGFLVLRDSRFFFRHEWNDKRHWVKLSLGAIDQRSFLGPELGILVSRRALPGLEQIYKFEKKYTKEKSYGFDVRFFEGVPTSQAISLDFNEEEDTPFYYNGKLSLFIKNMNKKFGYRFGVQGGVFNFSPLPSVVADESRLFGNTAQGIGAASEFLYDYKGWYAGWSTGLNFQDKWEVFPYVSFITNTEAPSGRNQGQTYGAQIKYHDQSVYSLSAVLYTFFNESDASVASYNGSTAGHNNREGYGMNLALDLPKRNLLFKLSYVHTDILEENGDLQVLYNYFGFQMEYKYDL